MAKYHVVFLRATRLCSLANCECENNASIVIRPDRRVSEKKLCSCRSSCSNAPTEIDITSSGAEAAPDSPWFRSTFRIPGMDCPSEEQMIRLRLSDIPMKFMSFDLPGRTLIVGHAGDVRMLIERLTPLGYGAHLQESRPLQSDDSIPVANTASEARVLWILLGINALMFVIEMIAGWWANSAGLISDAADMFADAVVYGVALYAVGKDAQHKLSAARISGMLQLVLALGALSETGRRIMTGSAPEEVAMIGISLLALAANVWCLLLISGHRHQGVHMRASYIFSANDVLANIGVILAGVLVAWSGSSLPDWIIGIVIGAMVLVGSIRILKLG